MPDLKICLIGNSHSGCFMRGWTAISSFYPSVDIRFYPHSGQFYGMFDVLEAEGKLAIDDDFVRNVFRRTSGGDGLIDFDEFDQALIVGGMFMGGIEAVIAGGNSKQLLEACVPDYFANEHVNVLIEKIRTLSNLPVSIIHNPLAFAKKGAPVLAHSKNYEQAVDLLNVLVLNDNNVRLLTQPAATRDEDNMTLEQYAAGERLTGDSLRPGNKQTIIDDFNHGNGAYGAVFLHHFLLDLGQAPSGEILFPEAEGHLPLDQKTSKVG